MSNSELRKRKNKEHSEKATVKRKKSKGVQPKSIQLSLLCLIASTTILTIFVVLYTDQIPWYLGHRAIDHVAKRFGYYKPVHAVVIDAGSTGSRVLAYTFHESYLGGYLVLDKELFEYNKPGLSSFAKEPHKGAKKIEELLDKAKQEIPEKYWSQTPLILKATAGLRLLPSEQAENLLNAVREMLKKTPFLTNENSVEIMEGVDEGIFSWFTVNFLLQRLSGNSANTVAALDLGGGSTQVTFSATTPSSLKQVDYIHEAVLPNGVAPVFTHSYLGLGLMSARQAVITSFAVGDSKNITCECVNPVVKNKIFHYHGIDYSVSGQEKNYPTTKTKSGEFYVGDDALPIVDFKKCSGIISKYIKVISSKAKPPEELPLKTIFAFSYYYDKASDAGLIDFSKGGQIKVEDFKKTAEKVCNETNTDQPFICMDLTYIWLLLEEGFGLIPETNIYLYKKISGHEISWALGAAYDTLRGKSSLKV